MDRSFTALCTLFQNEKSPAEGDVIARQTI